ncbi:MAG: phosphoglucosamine mutase [Candidatus Aminicenantes bacterium]|jgi:phosphomannomutase
MKKGLSLKISVSGVRGIVGDSLTPQLVSSFAQAFGTYLGCGRVIVGQDARPSGTMIKNAILSGLLSVGCQPIEIGVCPIPSAMVLTKESQAIGAVVVTASHNPPEWNGLKFINGNGLFLSHSQVQEFLDIYHQGEFSWVKADRHRNPTVEPEPTSPHLQKLLDYLDVSMIRKKKYAVVADCCRGAGARLLPEFLEHLGCQSIFIDNKREDSKLPHHEPTPENITELCQKVKINRADIGFVQDADADRLAVINEKGEPLGEELTLALAVEYVLSRKSGPVVINLSTSRAVEDIAQKYRAPVYRTKIGEINVVEQILQHKAVIGGEGNGGVIFPSIHPCRDSFTAMGLTLEAMASSGKTVSQLREKIPHYVMVKDKVEGSFEQGYRILRLLKKKYEDKENISILDGLKIDFMDSWVHIRPSNTEPIIRLYAEAPSLNRAHNLVFRFKKDIKDLSHGNHH